MASSSPLRQFLVSFLMPEKCYEEIFVNIHMHAQLSQLLKILWKGGAAGLSLTSALLQLYAFSCPVLYAAALNFPLFAWTERLVTLAQTAAIVFLILFHGGETLKGLLFLVAYAAVMLLLGSWLPAAVASWMQTSSPAALIASKALQARTNYCNEHTGQLSTLSVSLSCAGSLGVLFTSLQETGSLLSTLSHILSACLSCVLLVQVLSSSRGSRDATKRKSE
ncbi:Mannose-P-dolichol utilization defect 1 protein [Larimichthys crocea]|uniref:Mannose-P-dolichol utilization defect 1 protein n=1 Tax=Larimichthys crocea TaxID=215358 RepID=A0A6G0IA37_LARCR|nr:Mannose-P-dolichol utilization defect 1 protein [Larimichthys crocea]